MATIKAYKNRDNGQPYTFTTLAAPGATSDVLDMGGCEDIVFQYTIATMNTTVVVRGEGSLDNSSWFNLDTDEQDTTQTADGTYAMQYSGRVGFVRFRFVSETGGTAATVAIKAYIGRAI